MNLYPWISSLFFRYDNNTEQLRSHYPIMIIGLLCTCTCTCICINGPRKWIAWDDETHRNHSGCGLSFWRTLLYCPIRRIPEHSQKVKFVGWLIGHGLATCELGLYIEYFWGDKYILGMWQVASISQQFPEWCVYLRKLWRMIMFRKSRWSYIHVSRIYLWLSKRLQ